jgi:hypothetical protein
MTVGFRHIVAKSVGAVSSVLQTPPDGDPVVIRVVIRD